VRQFPGLSYAAADLLAAQQRLVRACENRQQGIALLDLPLRSVGDQVLPLAAAERVSWLAELRSERAATYTPWLRTDAGGTAVTIGPAAVAAGLIARRERERGVWFAPANLVAQAVFAATETVGEELAGALHEERINAFRSAPAGLTLLGARTTSAEPICSVDILPTACALAGIVAPADRALDGTSLLPLFAGQPLTRPHPLYWQYDFAISNPWAVSLRDGRWKLLGNSALDQFELYDLTADVGEKQNVAAQYPDRVKTLTATLRRLHTEINAEGAKSGNPPPRQNTGKKE
jgi:hypothetical protein